MKVLGIDPGTTRIGYGIIDARGAKLTHERSGLLSLHLASGGGASERLYAISRAMDDLIRAEQPDRIGVERLFVTKNQKTAMRVSEARGAILAAAARRGVPVVELTPSAVKCSVTGDGRASKAAVARMVCALLKLHLHAVDDVTDALAIAITATQPTFPDSPRGGTRG